VRHTEQQTVISAAWRFVCLQELMHCGMQQLMHPAAVVLAGLELAVQLVYRQLLWVAAAGVSAGCAVAQAVAMLACWRCCL
jgi:hypothetical protein